MTLLSEILYQRPSCAAACMTRCLGMKGLKNRCWYDGDIFTYFVLTLRVFSYQHSMNHTHTHIISMNTFEYREHDFTCAMNVM